MSVHSQPRVFHTAGWDALPGRRLSNCAALRITLWENGAIGSIECGDILINQMRGMPPEGAPFRLWARVDGHLIELLNPSAVIAFSADERRAI